MSHERAPLPAGVPCWHEVAGDDPAAARAFYRQVLGWEAGDQDMGPLGRYTLFRHGGREVAGGYVLRPEQQAVGLAAHWLTYFAVPDVHGAAARVGRLGGQTLVAPTEVPGMERLVVAAAPGGALFGLWQDLTGAPWQAPPQSPGMPCWVELHTRDPQRAESFYRDLLDWRAGERDYGGRTFTVLFRGDQAVASLDTESTPAGNPDLWVPYFAVTDAAEALATATAAGGRVAVDLRTVPGIGRYGVVDDPRGARFGVKEFP